MQVVMCTEFTMLFLVVFMLMCYKSKVCSNVNLQYLLSLQVNELFFSDFIIMGTTTVM